MCCAFALVGILISTMISGGFIIRIWVVFCTHVFQPDIGTLMVFISDSPQVGDSVSINAALSVAVISWFAVVFE